MKLSYKLLIAPLVSVTAIITLVLFTTNLTQRTKGNISHLVDTSIVQLSEIVAIEEQLTAIKAAPTALIVLTMMGEDSLVQLEAIKAEKELQTFLSAINAIPQLQGDSLNSVKKELKETFIKILEFSKIGDSYSSQELYPSLNNNLNYLSQMVGEYSTTVVKSARKRGELSKKAITKAEIQTKSIGYITTAFVILLNLLVTTFLIRALTRIFSFLKNYLGKNDFTGSLHIKRNDEIGDFATWINSFSQHMRAMILKIRERALHLEEESISLQRITKENSTAISTITDETESVESTSVTLKSSMVDISSGSKEIVDFISSTAAATEELSSSITDINTSSTKANTYSAKLDSQVVSLSGKMESLESSFQNISEIVEQVTTIAKQTKLLSINANVEAVRAGTAGKSFGVVAREVSTLADNTTKAAFEINKDITRIHEETQETMTEFKETKNMIEKLIQHTGHISTMIKEQMVSAEQISANNVEASGKLDAISQQVANSTDNSATIASSIVVLDSNLANVEQSTNTIITAADKLYEISSELENLVEEFVV